MIQPRWPFLVLLVLLTACTGGGDPGSQARPDDTREAASGNPAPAGYATQSVGELTFSVLRPRGSVEAPAGGTAAAMQLALRAPAAEGVYTEVGFSDPVGADRLGEFVGDPENPIPPGFRVWAITLEDGLAVSVDQFPVGVGEQ